jgi:nitroreductase
MELSEVLRRRHMVRSFSGRPLAAGELERLLSAARRAPRAGNTDGWDVVVLSGEEETSLFWRATTTDEWRNRSRRWPGLSRAPVVICLFASPDAYVARYGDTDKQGSGIGPTQAGGGGEAAWPVPYWFVDAGFAALSVLLSATDMGLGACLLGNFRGEDDLLGALGVPKDRRYFGAVVVGEAGGDDAPSSSLLRRMRRDDEIVHFGRW